MDVVRNIKAQDLPADIKGPDIGEMLIERRIHANWRAKGSIQLNLDRLQIKRHNRHFI